MKIVQIKNAPQFLKKLAASKGKSVDYLRPGFKKAALFLQHESQLIVPVQTGNLKNSAFTRDLSFGRMIDVVIGYTAKYAAFVHEDLTKAHGAAFNRKHRDEITRAGKWSSNLKTQRTTFRAYGKMGTARGGTFPRGENQQAKFIETPARIHRLKLLQIIQAS